MGDEESLQKNLKLANQELRSRLKSYKEKGKVLWPQFMGCTCEAGINNKKFVTEAQIRETLRDYGLEKRLEYIPDSLLYPVGTI